VAALAGASAVVATAQPVAGEGGAPADPVLASLPDFPSLTSPTLSFIAYVSSTSVYGSDRGGAWVGEGEERPCNATGLARVEAEAAWRAAAGGAGVRAATFRAGGIYGPGRSALDIVSGARTSRRDDPDAAGAPVSRIHALDLARGLLAAAQAADAAAAAAAAAATSSSSAAAWTVYNAVDADPAPRGEVLAAARALLAGERPVEGPGDRPEPSAGKRVRGAAFAALLEGKGGLAFPTYREGLAGILRGEGGPFGV